MTTDPVHLSAVVPRSLLVQADAMSKELRIQAKKALETAIARRPHPLLQAIDAERKEMRTHRGQLLSYYQDKSAHGRPIVLLHSINACASAYEMKPIFERFRGARPVYALDLPGFGFSGRDDRPYTPELYVEEISEVLARVKDKHDAPDVVALSLSCEFAATIATARKDLVHSLTFISPTGLATRPKSHPLSRFRSVADMPLASLLEPLLSKLLFSAISSRPSIRYFLGKSFVGHVDSGLASYAFATAHQRGADHAPLAFLQGKLFTPEIYETYLEVKRPTLVLYDQDGYTSFERLDELVACSPGWQAKRLHPSRGMPQFERASETGDVLHAFWEEHGHANHGHPS
jgi:pimeloyl-ACP methyl ester carboxylesterase